MQALARTSHPRAIVDTVGLSPEATELANLLASHIGDLTRADIDEVIAALEAHRVPCGPVLNPFEAITHPYFIERGTVRDVEDPFLGTLKLPGFPLRFSEQSDYGARGRQAPLLGEHNEAVLGELLGYDRARIDALTADGVVMERAI